MAAERISIKVIPTPATQDISEANLLRLSRITKLPLERVRDRVSKGKIIQIITPDHPKLDQVLQLIRSLGFSVTTAPAESPSPARPIHSSLRTSFTRVEEDEWRVGDIIENLYEVRDIKQGGMGAVYVVRHRRWNTMLAVKSLLRRLRENEEDKALFVKEAETWIDIGFHPNIAACYYVRNINDSPRIFIEYIDGGALNEWLRQRRHVGWDLLIDLMVQFSDALGHAHSKGLVHRDVKPGNCLMTGDGTLKVTDFGLTKRRSQDSVVRGIGNGPLMTETLTIERTSVTAAGMGTPGYMAPEMWIPHSEVGPPADIYAFGVMFFELCCGRKPFVLKTGERRDKIALAHVKKPPPRPSAIRRDIPPVIEEIILKCLEKNPFARYPSFLAVREALVEAYGEVCHKRLTREPPDEVRLISDALNNRAVSLMDLNHEEEAVRAWRRALESDPHHPEAVFNLGILEWLRSGNPEREIVVRMEEVVKAPEYVGRGAHLLGRSLLALGDASNALKACELSLSADDASESWLKDFGIALIGTGKEQEAIDHLKNYLKGFPTDDEASGWLIGAQVRQGLADEAIETIKSLPPGSEIGGAKPEDIARSFTFSVIEEDLVLPGHGGWITGVAHFPRSDLILVGARDRSVKIWDSKTGEERKTFLVVGQPATAIRISPDERLVAIASSQSAEPVKMLDLESGRFVGHLIAHEGTVTAVGFSRDGSHILTVGSKGAARMWEVAGLRAARSFKLPAHAAAEIISADPDDVDIVLAGMDRLVRRLRPLDQFNQPFEPGHKEVLTCLKATPDGSRVVTAGRDKHVIVWDGSSGKMLTEFRGHQDAVTDVALNPVRNLAASCDSKGVVKVWDSSTGFGFRTFSTGEAEANCIAFTPDGDRLIGGGRDMTVRVWDVRGRPMVPNLALAKVRPVKKQMRSDRKFKATLDAARKAMKRGAFSVAYSLLRDSQSLAGYERSDTPLELIVSMRDHGKRVGLRGGWMRKSFELPRGVMHLSVSPSAINFLTAQSDHTVRMWSTRSGECLKVLKDHASLVAVVRYSVNGREAASGGDDRTIRIWDLNTARVVLILKGHTDSVSCVSYSDDGSQLVSGSWDQTVRLWRLPDGGLTRILKGHEDKITSVQFTNGSERVVSASFDTGVKMWETATGRLLRDLKGHRDTVTSLSVSPRGDILLSGSMDGTARMWDLKTGMCSRIVDVSEAGVKTTAFSPDGTFFVTGGSDAVLRLWDTATGMRQREFQGHSSEIAAAEFSSNGRFIISAAKDGTVMIWELDWEWRFEAAKGPGR